MSAPLAALLVAALVASAVPHAAALPTVPAALPTVPAAPLKVPAAPLPVPAAPLPVPAAPLPVPAAPLTVPAALPAVGAALPTVGATLSSPPDPWIVYKERLVTCGNDAICTSVVDAVAGDPALGWPAPSSMLFKLLNCMPSTPGSDVCSYMGENWPLYHAVGDPGAAGGSSLVSIKPPRVDLSTQGIDERHEITVQEAKYNFIGNADCNSGQTHTGCTYVWGGASHSHSFRSLVRFSHFTSTFSSLSLSLCLTNSHSFHFSSSASRRCSLHSRCPWNHLTLDGAQVEPTRGGGSGAALGWGYDGTAPGTTIASRAGRQVGPSSLAPASPPPDCLLIVYRCT